MSRFRRVFLVGSGLLGGGSLLTLALNNWDFNSIGAVRLGRAVIAVSSVPVD